MTEKEEKTITVRNVDKETYEKLMALARELGVKSGEILNQAIRNFIATVEYGSTLPITISKELGKRMSELGEKMNVSVISNIDRLSIDASDLREVKGRVLFRNIKELRIGSDVDRDLFQSKVAGIVLVDRLVIPPTLPKLLVLQKARFVEEVVVGSDGESQ